MEMATFGKLFQEALLAGLILFDGTPAYRTPGDPAPVARYDTGAEVQVIRARTVPVGGKAEERFYQIKLQDGTAWVPARSVHVSASRPEDGVDPSLPLSFYRRAAKSRDKEGRELGARGLMRLLKGRPLLEAWAALQRDESDQVRCAADEAFSERADLGDLSRDARFNGILTDALLRSSGNCGLDKAVAASSHPDRALLEWLDAEQRPDPTPEQAARLQALHRQGLTLREAWARRNMIARICGYGRGLSDDDLRTLAELFPRMTPEDKEAVLANECYPKPGSEAGGPLLRSMTALIGDRSQPDSLRLRALEIPTLGTAEKRARIRAIVQDPGDKLRFALAGGRCDRKDVVEEVANHGDDATFLSALTCLDGMLARRTGPYVLRWDWYGSRDDISGWTALDFETGLQSIEEPGRRAMVERRLGCLAGRRLCPVRLSAEGG